jgi:hypothetical protein
VIVKIHRSGTSFKSLAQYLGHDPKSDTTERVAWAHTLNCSHDDVGSAVDSMLWTYRQADLLKEQAGISPGGRRVERPVKHVSLSWHESEEPSRALMISAVESYLDHMGWSEHEAVLFAHEDKAHPHVHIMLNRVDPADGTALDDGYDKRRSQEWALAYEREHGMFCEQRVMPQEQRTPSPTRATWEVLREFEKEDQAAENSLRNSDHSYMDRGEKLRIIEGEEWNILKDSQREAREAFFVSGKQQYSEIRDAAYHEVRTIFREEWKNFYAANRKGGLDAETLGEIKRDILDRQKNTLIEYQEEFSRLLREERDVEYRRLLDAQREERATLHQHQEDGVRSYELLDLESRKRDGEPWRPPEAVSEERANIWSSLFRAAAEDICDQRGGYLDLPEIPEPTPAENARTRDGPNMVADLGGGLIGGLATVGEHLFDGFFGGDAPRQRTEPAHRPATAPKDHWETVRDNPFLRVAEQARQAAIEQDEELRRRAWWDDRERTRD